MNTILMSLIMMTMTYEMPKLPYANNALEPVISQQTIDFHYGKHLQTYVNNLNSLVPGTEYEGKTVEEATKYAQDGGYTVRITEENGVGIIVTMEARMDRINFRVRNGYVIDTYGG